MAKMIPPQASAAMHLLMAKRHVRLCGRLAATKKFIAPVQQVMSNLETKENERKIASEERDYAYDDVILCDTDLDNAVRSTFTKIQQYDRQYLTQYLHVLFPTGRFSDLIRMPLSKEPQEVNNLAVKIEQLDEGHELKPMSALLYEKAAASAKAWEVYQQAIASLNKVQSLEELAKLAVRTQYEHNWLDARKEFGVSVADRLFPKISSGVHHNSDTPPAADDEE